MTEPLFVAGDDDLDRALELLRQMPKYPFDDPIDRQMICRLREEFPTVDVRWEIEKWTLWMSEHESKKKVRYRARLASWIRRSAEYQRARSARNGVSGQAEAAEVHGRTSDRLEQW